MVVIVPTSALVPKFSQVSGVIRSRSEALGISEHQGSEVKLIEIAPKLR